MNINKIANLKQQDNIPKLRFPEFSGEWEKKKLGETCKMQAGKFINASDIKDIWHHSLYPCYGGNGLRGYTNSYNNDGKYSLIGRQGAHCGNVNLANGKFYATEHAVVVYLKEGFDTDYMYHILGNLNLNQYSTGLAQPGLAVQNLEKIEACVSVSLPEQQKIATFLTSVDDKLQALKKKKSLLEQYKKGVMQRIFNDKSKNDELRIRFKNDDGSEFPEWEVKKLGAVCELNPKNSKLPDVFIYIDLESVENGVLLKENEVLIDEAPSRAQRLLIHNDILFQMVRPYQMNNLFFKLNGNYVASTGYAQIRTNLNAKYIFHYLHLQKFVDKVIERCTGTSYPSINSSDLANIEIQIPSIAEQTKIANFLSAIDEKIQLVSAQIEKMEVWKKGLLQKMFV